MGNLAPLLSSGRMDWQTPDSVLQLVRVVFGGSIELDPATTAENPTDARGWFYPPEFDGLLEPWVDRTFVNPPYGRELPRWAEKIATEALAGREIIALLPARTDTRWFQAHVATADALCFWRGRIKFRGAPAHAPFPSVVVYYGDRARAFNRVFGAMGWCP